MEPNADPEHRIEYNYGRCDGRQPEPEHVHHHAIHHPEHPDLGYRQYLPRVSAIRGWPGGGRQLLSDDADGRQSKQHHDFELHIPAVWTDTKSPEHLYLQLPGQRMDRAAVYQQWDFEVRICHPPVFR